ncbi:hypothetical protein [Thiomonas sp. FB-6]|uniref:hypothetical protein n=1 Tax=Thiomonas sp. FB-6 TaxID=1158291 RepID=UPI000365CFCE|nr:hypothetical protein [Thiomonas sp. FB-6]
MGTALVLMLVCAALAPNVPLMAAACLGMGLSASLAQQIIPLVAHLAAPQRRGRAVGLVMSGLLVAGQAWALGGWPAVAGAGAAFAAAALLLHALWNPGPAPAH